MWIRRTVRAFVAFVLVVSASLVFDAGGRVSAVRPGRDGRIAFTRADQVYTIRADGTGIRQLTDARGGKTSWPKWSPHGRRIAFVWEMSDAGTRNLWIMNADGSGKTQVTTTGDVEYGPAWSPDGNWLAFIRGGVLHRIRTTPPFGAPTPISGASDPSSFEDVFGTPSWSATGNWLAIQVGCCGAPGYDMYLFHPVTKVKRRVAETEPGDCGSVGSPAFSADGTLLRYSEVNSCDRPSIRTIRVRDQMRIDEGFTSEPSDHGIASAPSGTRVALVNGPYVAPMIYIANLDGGPRRVLTEGHQPDWQPLPFSPPSG